MGKVCVILTGPVKFDVRVKKVVETMAGNLSVDLFYLDGDEDDGLLFDNKNIRLFVIRKKNTLLTKLLSVSFFYRENYYIIKEIKKNPLNYDFIYANDLPALWLAYRLKINNRNAKLIYDSREIYLEILNQLFPETKNIFRKLLYFAFITFMRFSGRMAERKLLGATDFRITVSGTLANYFKDQYGYDFKIMMNCPLLNNDFQAEVDFRKIMNWNKNDRIFLYQGRLNRGRGLKLLCEAMVTVHKNIKLVIVGQGTLKQELVRYIHEKGLDHRIYFIDFVDYKELWGYLTAADFGITFLEKINLNTTYGLPNKFFDYIHARVPVLCSESVGFKNIIEDYKVGIMTKLEAEEIKKSMEQLAFCENINEMKNNCDLARRRFNWQDQSKILLDILLQ